MNCAESDGEHYWFRKRLRQKLDLPAYCVVKEERFTRGVCFGPGRGHGKIE